jgi:hypothetical protein
MTTKREEGYYWVTAWGQRLIAYWNNYTWECFGSVIDIPSKVITDINENRIIEDGTE